MFLRTTFCLLLLLLLIPINSTLAQFEQTRLPTAMKKKLAKQRKIAEAALNKGLELSAEKKFAEAEAEFKRGLAADSTLTELYEELGWLYNEQENFQAAAEILQQGALIKYDSPLLYNELAFAYYKLNKPDEAIGKYMQATALKPDYEAAQRGLGDAFFYLAKDYKQALEPYKKALQLNPNQPSISYNVGWILNDIERYDEAVAYLQRAIEQNVSELAYAYQECGFAHAKLKHNNEAVQCFQKAIELKRDYALAYFGLGDVYFNNLKQYTDAAKAYEKGLKYKSDAPEILYRFGWCLSESQQYEAALEPLQKVVTNEPKNINAKRELGYAHMQLKRYDEAQSIFKQLLQQNEKDALTLFYLGLTYVAKKDRTNAVATSTSLSFLDSSRAISLKQIIQKNLQP